MKKICFTLALLLCCGSAFAFDFDPIGTVKKVFGSVADEKRSGITNGFSRDDRLEVVKDDIYKLMWQDGEEIFKGDYDEAVKYCENLNFAGFDDWRLPTINELLSITDDARVDPAINKAFKNIAYKTNDKGEKSYDSYWSSTKSANSSSNVWIMYFLSGGDNWAGVSDHGLVRCVRQY